MPLAEAYAACARLAAAHYENFPVASRLLPSRMRPHIAAVYAFARTADDFADEDRFTLEERHALLDDWQARLRRAARGAVPSTRTDGSALDAQADEASSLHPERGAVDPDLVFEALANTIDVCSLEPVLLENLLSAFRQDTVVKRYATWDEVLDYCRRSANPVGRLVLQVAGYRDEALDTSSDALCTALQLTNFWQDLAIDWRRGRLYLPASERDAAGAQDADLDAARMTPEWRRALSRAAARTRDLFDRGRPVCDGVSGRLGYELRATWLGGARVLDRLEATGFDVFNRRPSLGAGDVPALAWQLVTWRARPRRRGRAPAHRDGASPG